MLQLLWEERGGPAVEQPVTRGFGTRSVIASIETQLGGKAEFDWRTEGLICRLSVPLPKTTPARETALHHQSTPASQRAIEQALRSA
jgi:two-component sensor histidine kinase